MSAAKSARSESTSPAQGVAATHEPRSPIPFRERVYALCGHTTWRDGDGSRSTVQRQIPSDHMVAAALSFGRVGRGDVGPDIAFDMALGVAGHRVVVLRWLGAELLNASSRANYRPARACRDHLGTVAAIAYNAMTIGACMVPAPEGIAAEAWGECVLFACLLLEQAGEDALATAERKQRRN